MLTWTRPTAKPDYWEGDHGFWITAMRTYNLADDTSFERWALYNGDNDLGRYDTLAEAKAAAEPEHTNAWQEEQP